MSLLDSPSNRRTFLTRGAAVAAVPALGALAGTAFTTGTASAATADLPDYAPIPAGSLGPALNADGYYVGRIKDNLHWVTDGTYQAAFLLTREGVVLFDAPPTIGHNLQRAIDAVAGPAGMPNKVTHIVYSHHHADHLGGSFLFGKDVVRIGHTQNRALLLRDNDPARPLPNHTFDERMTLHVGGERVELAHLGTNHTPDNIYIHFPDHDTLMLVDINLPGWVPFDSFNLNEDVQGSIAAPAKAMAYPWSTYIGGHMGRLGTRADMTTYQQYVEDLIVGAKASLTAVDPTPFFAKYGDNTWAAVKNYQAAQVKYAADPVVRKYTGVLAAADVYTESTAFVLLEAVRLDLGIGSQVHP
ncbi:glyoxylase-like metal-dependent hydrolase (beta-lactamase superfamily II) [Streptacidiphilus sp. MAP12-33]|uniref:MBL fold metallo-hydrolase n=1 Tax=Streptacidiphilus sp. MAP12-33 TaxID=3156266 RepID=UPI003511DC8C